MSMPRKSLELHSLSGTTPEYAPPTEGPTSSIPISKPRMPERIKADKEAAAEWREIVRDLRDRGTLTRADGRMIALYCDKSKQRRKALKHLDDEGLVCEYTRLDSNGVERVTEKKNVYWGIAQECERAMMSLLDRLGLHPINKDKPRRGVMPKPKPMPEPEPNLEETLSPLAAELMKKLKSEENND
jgi:P27 family predicted phage terminase small subunit